MKYSKIYNEFKTASRCFKTLAIFVVVRRENDNKRLSSCNDEPMQIIDLNDWRLWNHDWRLSENDEQEQTDAQTDDDDDDPPCLNCSLILQGSAISYADNRCPQCGKDTREIIF